MHPIWFQDPILKMCRVKPDWYMGGFFFIIKFSNSLFEAPMETGCQNGMYLQAHHHHVTWSPHIPQTPDALHSWITT